MKKKINQSLPILMRVESPITYPFLGYPVDILISHSLLSFILIVQFCCNHLLQHNPPQICFGGVWKINSYNAHMKSCLTFKKAP